MIPGGRARGNRNNFLQLLKAFKLHLTKKKKKSIMYPGISWILIKKIF